MPAEKSKRLNIGIIGLGAWGPNHVRVFERLCRVVSVADRDQAALTRIREYFPELISETSQSMLQRPDVDAVIIATPTSSHYELVKTALLQNKHVLCEKPLVLKSGEAQELKMLAAERKRVLMTGFVFLFNNGIVTLKEYMKQQLIGDVYYGHATRTNFGPIRSDVNAAWDLASHDIAIFNYVFEHPPLNVSARGVSLLNPHIEDVTFINLTYPPNILVNIHVSWLDPKKVREITLIGSKKMLSWNDLDHIGPIRIYDKSIENVHGKYLDSYGEFKWVRFEGNLTIPNITVKEPLFEQAKAFIQMIHKEAAYVYSLPEKAKWVTTILEKADMSMSSNGQTLYFEPGDFE